ncbi:ninjurin-2 isoform X4 [Aethina tumida]|uniref:ninjurin-2 isoform X4 n=1 Tax=Aethina tumida TaxID=116153 RepID=UPI0021489BF7|nr:ninjurin-2 isoform X4 [Aethina tumida]
MSNMSDTPDGFIDDAKAKAKEMLTKSLDVNKYATKKTIAQGLLDVALLTANASQLKYVLQVGEKHEFYTLMLTLISISIILQVVVCCLYIFLGSAVNINKNGNQDSANMANNITFLLNGALFLINIFINSMDMIKDNGLASDIIKVNSTS